MQRTVIEYKEYGKWVCIRKIKNAATHLGLQQYFRQKGCAENAWTIYVGGGNLREDGGTDVSYYYDDMVDRLVIEYIAGGGPESYRWLKTNDVIKKEVFDEIIQDLQIAGERLEKIVVKYREKIKEVKI